MRSEMIVVAHAWMGDQAQQKLRKIVAEALGVFAGRPRERVVCGSAEHRSQRRIRQQGAVVAIPFFAGEIRLTCGAVKLLQIGVRSPDAVELGCVQAQARVKNSQAFVEADDYPQTPPWH